jgi:hypothetical protein
VITLEIATGMIVTLTETAMGAMTRVEIGIGEIATAAIGTVIGSSSLKQARTFKRLNPGLGPGQALGTPQSASPTTLAGFLVHTV